jgi:hypothetical protein
MYQTIYKNAQNLSERIRSGEIQQARKVQTPPTQGLMNRAMEETQAPQEDMLNIVSQYLADIKGQAPELEKEISRLSEEAPVQQAMAMGAPRRPNPQDIGDFESALIQSESGGRSGVQITARSGGREQAMTGLYQFSEGRLTDYKKNTGADFTVEEFRNNPDLQRDVFKWHISDIDRVIDRNDLLDKGYDRNGLRAVAHLGGINGMIRFARTKGKYNPADKFGTSLSDYYNRFGGQ